MVGHCFLTVNCLADKSFYSVAAAASTRYKPFQYCVYSPTLGKPILFFLNQTNTHN